METTDIEAIALLDEPRRRRLYEYVSERDSAVGRERAAAATGMSRGLAAFHLDRLAEAGLLDVEYRRLTGRSGPGAGRPAKLYRRAERRVSINLPATRYELAGNILASALEERRPVESTKQVVRRVAKRIGLELGRRGKGRGQDRTAPIAEVLDGLGFEPEEASGLVRLRNCPFHALAQRHTDLICSMNQAFLEGVLGGLGAVNLKACLQSRPGYCCVTIMPRV